MVKHSHDLELELRKYALSEAARNAYVPGSMTAVGGSSGGLLSAGTVVERAKVYYDFLCNSSS